MNTKKDDSRQQPFQDSSARSAENSQCLGLDATATMSKRETALATPTSCLYEPLTPENRSSHVASADLQKNVERSTPERPSTPSDSKTEPQKSGRRFKLCEKLFQQPIEGMVTIYPCSLKKYPNIRRVIQSQLAGTASASQSTDPEVQALNKPVAPVNKDTTKELELSAIQNNTSLRIDLCHDDQLFFQPIKGRRGEEKQRRARIFWDCLSLELDAYRHVLSGSCSECSKNTDSKTPNVQIPSRLAEFFSALRDLVEMLVPEKDKAMILERLQVDNLVRSSRTGVFDAVDFSNWLTRLLMTHCAPLRDGMARKMNQQISEGARTNNMNLLVKGLETLLTLLENMKLDVANHQVRSFKLLLIADTVPFLQDCFAKMQAEQQLDPKASQRWFKELKRRATRQDISDFEIFVSGTVKLCRSPCSPKTVPATFMYDKDRLVCLRNEVLDLTQLRTCINTFDELVISRQRRRSTSTEQSAVRDRLLQLMSAEDGTSEGVACHLDEIATEIARAAAAATTEVEIREQSREVKDVDFQYALNRLETRFAIEQSSVMESLLNDLTQLTLEFALQFQKLDTLQLSNAQRAWTTKRSAKGLVPPPDMEDIARRLAHIIVIHWAVWAKLTYIDEEGDKSTSI